MFIRHPFPLCLLLVYKSDNNRTTIEQQTDNKQTMCNGDGSLCAQKEPSPLCSDEMVLDGGAD